MLKNPIIPDPNMDFANFMELSVTERNSVTYDLADEVYNRMPANPDEGDECDWKAVVDTVTSLGNPYYSQRQSQGIQCRRSVTFDPRTEVIEQSFSLEGNTHVFASTVSITAKITIIKHRFLNNQINGKDEEDEIEIRSIFNLYLPGKTCARSTTLKDPATYQILKEFNKTMQTNT